MRTYAIYIHDARYSVPTLVLVDVRADMLVADLARQKLEESPHYRSVEVMDGETLLFRVTRDPGTP